MTMQKGNLDEEDRYIQMQAKRDGKCSECSERIYERDDIIWDTKEYKAYCAVCGEDLK